MSRSAGKAYAAWGAAVSLAGLGLLAVFAGTPADEARRWALIGWGVMTIPGVAGGAWMAASHGKPGSPFIVALGACMLSRLFAAAAGAAAAALAGGEAVWAYVAGLAVGFVPLQIFEIGWFARTLSRTDGQTQTPAATRGRPGPVTDRH